MGTLKLKLYTIDYEGNSQDYDITIDLETWKVEIKKGYEESRYPPHVKVTEIEIVMEKEFLEKKGVQGDYLDVSKYGLS
jgi:hypothetical protein